MPYFQKEKIVSRELIKISTTENLSRFNEVRLGNPGGLGAEEWKLLMKDTLQGRHCLPGDGQLLHTGWVLQPR